MSFSLKTGFAALFSFAITITLFASTDNEIKVTVAPPDQMEQYDTFQIKAKAGSEYPLSYRSTDSSVITVSNSGMITCVGGGKSVVYIEQLGGRGFDYAFKAYDVTVDTRSLVIVNAISNAIGEGEPLPDFFALSDSEYFTDTELKLSGLNFFCPVNETDVSGTYDIIPYNANKEGYAFAYKTGRLTIRPKESRGPQTLLGFYSTGSSNQFAGQRFTLFITAPDVIPYTSEEIELTISGGTYGVDYIVNGIVPNGNKFKAKTSTIVNNGFIIETFNNPAKSGSKVSLNFSIRTYPQNIVTSKASKCKITIMSKDIEETAQCSPIGHVCALESKMITPYVIHADRKERDGCLNDSGLFISASKDSAPLGWMSIINYNRNRLQTIDDFVRYYTGVRSSYKAEHLVNVKDVKIDNLYQFIKKPSFMLTTYDLVKDPKFKKPKVVSMTIKKQSHLQESIIAISNVKINLCNLSELKKHRNNGFFFYQCENQVQEPYLGAQWLMTYNDNSIAKINIKKAPIGAVIFTPPFDAIITDTTYNTVAVKGENFGAKPSALIEYYKGGKVRTKSCKVIVSKEAIINGNVPEAKIELPYKMKSTAYDSSKGIRLLLNSGTGIIDLGEIDLPEKK